MSIGKMTKRKRLLTPRAREIGRALREERWYTELATCPSQGARRLAATLLVGAILDVLKAEDRAVVAAEGP